MCVVCVCQSLCVLCMCVCVCVQKLIQVLKFLVLQLCTFYPDPTTQDIWRWKNTYSETKSPAISQNTHCSYKSSVMGSLPYYKHTCTGSLNGTCWRYSWSFWIGSSGTIRKPSQRPCCIGSSRDIGTLRTNPAWSNSSRKMEFALAMTLHCTCMLSSVYTMGFRPIALHHLTSRLKALWTWWQGQKAGL